MIGRLQQKPLKLKAILLGVRQYPALAGFEQESKSVSACRNGKILLRSST
jgi:hypothetical protein